MCDKTLESVQKRAAQEEKKKKEKKATRARPVRTDDVVPERGQCDIRAKPSKELGHVIRSARAARLAHRDALNPLPLQRRRGPSMSAQAQAASEPSPSFFSQQRKPALAPRSPPHSRSPNKDALTSGCFFWSRCAAVAPEPEKVGEMRLLLVVLVALCVVPEAEGLKKIGSEENERKLPVAS